MTFYTQAFLEADEALYQHESPFYRFCASGFPAIFEERSFYEPWAKTRDLLQAQVTRLSPWYAGHRNARAQRNPFLEKVANG